MKYVIDPNNTFNGYILLPKSDEEIRSETKARLSMSEFEKEKDKLGDLYMVYDGHYESQNSEFGHEINAAMYDTMLRKLYQKHG